MKKLLTYEFNLALLGLLLAVGMPMDSALPSGLLSNPQISSLGCLYQAYAVGCAPDSEWPTEEQPATESNHNPYIHAN